MTNDDIYIESYDSDLIEADFDEYDLFGEIMEGDEDRTHDFDNIILDY